MGICCIPQETQTGALYQPRGWSGEADGREFQKGGDTHISMADPYWGLTENRKKKFQKKKNLQMISAGEGVENR